MDVNDSECNVHYSLDSQRDFEDFCEAVIRQTVDADLPHRRWPEHPRSWTVDSLDYRFGYTQNFI